jgi:hypothetical protein
MISLSKAQLQIVRAAASHVPPVKRAQFLERVSAMLQMRGRGHFSDEDVASVTALALTGLAHQPAA